MARRGPFAAILMLACCLAGTRSVGAEEAAVHEDPDYRFRIQSPGPGWQLLTEAEARQVVPDAVAGLTDLKGTHFVVIVEEAPGADLDGFVKVIQDNATLEDVTFGEVEALTFQGLGARRWSGSGTLNGLKIRLRYLIFRRAHYLYQLVAFGVGDPANAARGTDLDTLARHLVLTEGEIRPRQVAKTTRDAHGVGWRIRDGVYQDAANGIEVTPSAGWRLAVGFELAEMNDAACVGLVSSAPEAYLVLIVERARKVDREPFLEQLRDNVLATGAERVGSSVPRTIGGREFAMQKYHATAPLPITLHHGARLDDGRAVQVQAWYVTGLEERALPLVRAAYGAVRFLDEPARRALEAELSSQPDPQNSVGPRYTLRNGTYRDFEHRFTWRKPPGFWKVKVGQEARADTADATLAMEEPALGLTGSVIAQELPNVEPAALHRSWVEALQPKDGVPVPRTLQLDGATLLLSEVRPGTLELPFRFVLGSVVQDGRAYQIQIWGLAGNVEAARAEAEAAVRGLSLPKRLVAQERPDKSLVDHRLGFRVSAPPGTGWRFDDITPAAVAPIASFASFTGRPGIVLAGAVCALQEAQDSHFARDLMLKVVRAHAPVDSTPPEESDTTFLGWPARRIVFKSGGQRVTAWLIQRHRTFYLLMVGLKAVPGEPEEQAAGLFELLD